MERMRIVIDNFHLEEYTLQEMAFWLSKTERTYSEKLILQNLIENKKQAGFRIDKCTDKKLGNNYLYENDIVEFRLIQEVGSVLLRGIIEYRIDEMSFYIDIAEEGFSLNYVSNIENIVFMKIIGNIHQNEELLDFKPVLTI